MLSKDDGTINMNHVAKLTEYFLKRNQDLSLNLLFNYNLLFKFMQYINFPCVRDFLLFFIGNFYHQTRLTIKNQNKLWKYLQFSYFLQDFAHIMLSGSLSKFDVNKATDMYKAIDIELNIGIHETQAEDAAENDILTNSNSIKTSEANPVLEEFTGFRTDIDRIKEKVQNKTNIWAGKKLSNELMVIKAFRTGPKKKEQDVDQNVGEFARKLLKTIETVRLTEFINIPKPKEDQLMKSLFDNSSSYKSSPLRKSQQSKSILLTRPPLKALKSVRSLLPSENSVMSNSLLKELTINNKNENNLTARRAEKKKTTIIMEKIIGKNTIPAFENEKKGYLFESAPYIPQKKQRKELYPLSFRDFDETKFDRKARSKVFEFEYIEETDKVFGLHAAEILSIIIKNAIENYDHPFMKKIINFNGKEYSLLINAIFQPDKGIIFTMLFEVFFFLNNFNIIINFLY